MNVTPRARSSATGVARSSRKEGEIRESGRGPPGFDGVAAHIGLGQIEGQPALLHIRGGKTQLVAEEGLELLGRGGVEHRVDTVNHRRASQEPTR